MLGTIVSFSPWIIRVGQVMAGRSSMQMLPGHDTRISDGIHN